MKIEAKQRLVSVDQKSSEKDIIKLANVWETCEVCDLKMEMLDLHKLDSQVSGIQQIIEDLELEGSTINKKAVAEYLKNIIKEHTLAVKNSTASLKELNKMLKLVS